MFISEKINIQLREVLGKLVLIRISYISSEIPGILNRKPNDGSEERGKTEKKILIFLSISRLVCIYTHVYCFQLKKPKVLFNQNLFFIF